MNHDPCVLRHSIVQMIKTNFMISVKYSKHNYKCQ